MNLILCPPPPPTSTQTLQVLGELSVLSFVDKKGVLSTPTPSVQKVAFVTPASKASTKNVQGSMFNQDSSGQRAEVVTLDLFQPNKHDPGVFCVSPISWFHFPALFSSRSQPFLRKPWLSATRPTGACTRPRSSHWA